MSDNTLTGCWRLEQVGQHSSDEDDLFSSMKSRRSEGTGELEGYLACVSVKMDLVNSFQNIKKLSRNSILAYLPRPPASDSSAVLDCCSLQSEPGCTLLTLNISCCSNSTRSLYMCCSKSGQK